MQIWIAVIGVEGLGHVGSTLSSNENLPYLSSAPENRIDAIPHTLKLKPLEPLQLLFIRPPSMASLWCLCLRSTDPDYSVDTVLLRVVVD